MPIFLSSLLLVSTPKTPTFCLIFDNKNKSDFVQQVQGSVVNFNGVFPSEESGLDL